MSCGYALSGLSPSPAVRLVPTKSTVCPVATALESARTESRRGDVLAFVTVSAATVVSSAFGLLHAAASARVAAISHVVQRSEERRVGKECRARGAAAVCERRRGG